MHLFLFSRKMGKEMWFGWFVGGLWLVCWWFHWFVGSLAGLWVVSSFTANITTFF